MSVHKYLYYYYDYHYRYNLLNTIPNYHYHYHYHYHYYYHYDRRMRAILIDWLVEVHLKFKLIPETLYLAHNLIDR